MKQSDKTKQNKPEDDKKDNSSLVPPKGKQHLQQGKKPGWPSQSQQKPQG